MGRQETGPPREPHIVDFVAVTQQAEQAPVDSHRGAAGQGKPADFFGSVDTCAQDPVDIAYRDLFRFYRHDVAGSA
jgi:hypothetical protein